MPDDLYQSTLNDTPLDYSQPVGGVTMPELYPTSQVPLNDTSGQTADAGIDYGGEDYSAIAASGVQQLGADAFSPSTLAAFGATPNALGSGLATTGSSGDGIPAGLSAIPNTASSGPLGDIFDKVLKTWNGTSSDTKTALAASLISGIFNYKNKQAMVDATVAQANSNVELNRNKIALANQQMANASGLVGSTLGKSGFAPVYHDILAQRRARSGA